MLCADIMRQAGTISATDWNYFLRGAGGVDKVRPGRGVGGRGFPLEGTFYGKGPHTCVLAVQCHVLMVFVELRP